MPVLLLLLIVLLCFGEFCFITDSNSSLNSRNVNGEQRLPRVIAGLIPCNDVVSWETACMPFVSSVASCSAATNDDAATQPFSIIRDGIPMLWPLYAAASPYTSTTDTIAQPSTVSAPVTFVTSVVAGAVVTVAFVDVCVVACL